ncbi:unnamed protein product [Mytilus edulis]|uniref:Uncharacterized protein n=1 Tax=Mytilus edulis TaxID=6550 RepID=A0A8S3UDX2_MYTED|nr:unnamed protein product [Mytilus edulis]
MDKINKIADDIIAVSYQINGCFGKVSRSNDEHGRFMNSSTDKIRKLGNEVRKEAMNLNNELSNLKKTMAENEKKFRTELCSLKKEKFDMKRKCERYEREQQFELEMSLLDDSIEEKNIKLEECSFTSTPMKKNDEASTSAITKNDDQASTRAMTKNSDEASTSAVTKKDYEACTCAVTKNVDGKTKDK